MAFPVQNEFGFETTLNQEYHKATLDNTSNVVSDIFGGAVASAVDFGASVWNSLPLTDEVTTRDLLARTNDSALRVYDEHPDLVHAASFIGGMFIPSTLALKSMRAMRAGVTGVNWFSDAGKIADAAKVEKLFSEGVDATKLWQDTRRTMLAKGVLNNSLDAVAMEAAVVGTMHAHPWMEDYMKDPAENFLISAAFGSVLGSGIGIIADHAAMAAREGVIGSKALSLVADHYAEVPSSAPLAQQLRAHKYNADTYADLLNIQGTSGPNRALNGLEKAMVEKNLLVAQTAEDTIFKQLFNAHGVPYTDEEIVGVRNLFNSSTALNGVESAYPAVLKKSSFTTPKGASQIKTSLLTDDWKVANPPSGKTYLKKQIYYPETNQVGSETSLAYMGKANVLNTTEANLMNGLDPRSHRNANVDFSFEVVTGNTPSMDKRYIQALKQVDSLSIDEFKKIVIAPEDLPMLKAVVARVAKDPDLYKDMKIRVTSELPSYQKIEQTIIQHSSEVAGGHGVKATHFEDIAKAVKSPAYNLSAAGSKLSSESKYVLSDWISGRTDYIRKAYQAILSHTEANADDYVVEGLKGLRDSPKSVAFREYMMQQADSGGFVYLYRGTRTGKARLYMPIESYTPVKSVALRFSNGVEANAKLHRIDVNQIIGVTQNSLNEVEILVGAPTHTQLASLPIISRNKLTEIGKTSQTITKTLDSDRDLFSMDAIRIHTEKQTTALIEQMIAQGVPLQTIAIKTSTPLDVLEAYVTNPVFDTIADAGVAAGKNWTSYTDVSKIPEYLSNRNRPLVLNANIYKAPWISMQSHGLDQPFLTKTNKQIMNDILLTTESEIAKGVGQFLFDRDRTIEFMRQGLGEAVNAKGGLRFLQSADFNLRNMGNFGIYVTEFGQRLHEIKNQAVEHLVKNMSEHASKLAAVDTDLIELSTALNLNSGLTGKRFYENRQFWQEVIDPITKETSRIPALWQGKEFKIISDSVDKMLMQAHTNGRELLALANTRRKMLGQAPISDIGFWVPSYSPVGKSIAYVYEPATDSTRLLIGNDDASLSEAIRTFKNAHPKEIANKELMVIEGRGDAAMYSQLSGRLDPLTMEQANIAMFHSGSSQAAIVKANSEIITELIQGYEYTTNYNISALAELYLSDITQVLDNQSIFNRHLFENQPLGFLKKLVKAPTDTSRTVKNILLAKGSLEESPNWRLTNQSFENGLNMVIQKTKETFDEFARPVGKLRGMLGKETSTSIRDEDYATLAKRIADIPGMTDPYAHFPLAAREDIFQQAKLTEIKNAAPRLIYASNALAATLALRFGELAQPLVNAMSLPILMMAFKAGRMPETFMGVQKGTAAIGSIAEVMHEGVRHMNSTVGKHLDDIWLAAGDYKALVSEASELLKMPLKTEVGMLPAVERGLQSNFVKWWSTPSDAAETFTRRVAMHTGAHMAKRLYPELDDMGITIFARYFRDRVIGNYMAAQRPTFFQGTLGTAMGLFQTYMLTFGQSMYRHLELKDYKAIGKTMLMQSGVFGAKSLPGFDLVSNAIGEHYSDENVDLTTGTFRAIGDPMAKAILYGLPSNLGPALYTRGEIQPRIPNLAIGAQSFAGVNMMMQTGKGVADVVKALGSDYSDMAQNIGEALSLQSVSRPIARGAELMTGFSRTRKGETVQVPEEVWSPVGIMSRLLSTRPLEEAKLRDAIHLNSFYGSLDADARNSATQELRTALRAGTLTNEKLSSIAEKYMRTGTPSGWKSAVSHAMATSNTSGKTALIEKLKPSNPLNFMIDSFE